MKRRDTVGGRTARAAVRREYQGLAGVYDRRWAAYLRGSLRMLRPHLRDARPGRLLDLGCDTAALVPHLRAWNTLPDAYVGVDASDAMLAVARGRLVAAPPACPWSTLTAAAEALPFHDGEFDTVVSASSLHDWSDAAAGLAEARRVIAPGGRLLLLDWARDPLTMRVLDRVMRWRGAAYHRMYAAGEMEDLLRRAAFAVRGRETRKITRVWGLALFEAVPA
jgi:ubiquinone/menaquinone biosynthesis C-methylase UbiE